MLYISLYGFKYMRDNEMVMPISKEGVMVIVDQVADMIKEGDLVQESGSEVIVSSPPKPKIAEKEGGEGNLGNKIAEYSPPGIEVQPSPSKKDFKPTEEGYLSSNGVSVDSSAQPSGNYLKKCAVCHGNYGTGFNAGKELLGGGIIHLNEDEIFYKLTGFQEGSLESSYMKNVLKGIQKNELRSLSSEISKFKKHH